MPVPSATVASVAAVIQAARTALWPILVAAGVIALVVGIVMLIRRRRR